MRSLAAHNSYGETSIRKMKKRIEQRGRIVTYKTLCRLPFIHFNILISFTVLPTLHCAQYIPILEWWEGTKVMM